VFEWIILAVLAAVILYQLYATLGRRVGRQPEDAPAAVPASAPARDLKAPEVTGEALSGLAALRARQADFDIGHFLGGARQAYELIVKAFAGGDRETGDGDCAQDGSHRYPFFFSSGKIRSILRQSFCAAAHFAVQSGA
jgi:hypothetical protein